MLDKKCWHWVRLNMGYNCNNEDYLAAITRRVFMETAAARDTWCDGTCGVTRCDHVAWRVPIIADQTNVGHENPIELAAEPRHGAAIRQTRQNYL